MAFRFYLQPIMSTIYAILSGIKDAREGRPPYFRALFTDPSHRADMLRDGWKSVRNVFLLAIGMDLVYQSHRDEGLRPLQGLLIAVVLALVPYLFVRGQVDRLARRLALVPRLDAAPELNAASTISRGTTTRCRSRAGKRASETAIARGLDWRKTWTL